MRLTLANPIYLAQFLLLFDLFHCIWQKARIPSPTNEMLEFLSIPSINCCCYCYIYNIAALYYLFILTVCVCVCLLLFVNAIVLQYNRNILLECCDFDLNMQKLSLYIIHTSNAPFIFLECEHLMYILMAVPVLCIQIDSQNMLSITSLSLCTTHIYTYIAYGQNIMPMIDL